jgi:hypothetical protein
MTDAESRDRELDNFSKTLSAKLDKEIAANKSEWKQRYTTLFESELREAKSCDERGDYFGAMGHKLFAEMINNFLKTLDS